MTIFVLHSLDNAEFCHNFVFLSILDVMVCISLWFDLLSTSLILNKIEHLFIYLGDKCIFFPLKTNCLEEAFSQRGCWSFTFQVLEALNILEILTLCL